jgi:hypothetical protein
VVAANGVNQSRSDFNNLAMLDQVHDLEVADNMFEQ